MAYNAYPLRVTQPEVWCHVITLTGTGAAVPTKNLGDGVAVTRSDVGELALTWSDNPGRFIGCSIMFGADTATGVDAWTAVYGAYSSSTRSLALTVFDGTPAAADLAAATYLTVLVWFKQTSV